MWRLDRPPHKKGVESRQRTYFHPGLEVNTIEQEYVLPTGKHNLSHRRGGSRVAARLQMAGDCGRLAGSDVAECGRFCRRSLSCV